MELSIILVSWNTRDLLAECLTSVCATAGDLQFEILVVDNNCKSNKLMDSIYWYKAEPHGPFRLGSKEFWDLSKDIASDDEEEEYDPSASKAKKGPKLNVKKAKW